MDLLSPREPHTQCMSTVKTRHPGRKEGRATNSRLCSLSPGEERWGEGGANVCWATGSSLTVNCRSLTSFPQRSFRPQLPWEWGRQVGGREGRGRKSCMCRCESVCGCGCECGYRVSGLVYVWVWMCWFSSMRASFYRCVWIDPWYLMNVVVSTWGNLNL